MSLHLVTEGGHEELVVVQDSATGLRGAIALHDSRRGPALCATRLRPDLSLEDAVREALRLASAMSAESAAADLARGGAAAVLVGPAAKEKSRPLLAAFGKLLERQGGRMAAITDMGFESRDAAVLGRITPHVLHRAGPSGDAAELAAVSVLEGLRETADILGTHVSELHVAVQGLGQVGYRVARLLSGEGARLTVSDVDGARVERAEAELGARAVAPDEIASVEADVLSPNAGSGALDDATVARLRCRAVLGAARAVLAGEKTAEALHERGILYAPDFLVCAGALAGLAEPGDEMEVQERVAQGAARLREVFDQSRQDGKSPLRAAELILEAQQGTRRGGP
jgi:leucine dehydrogenase